MNCDVRNPAHDGRAANFPAPSRTAIGEMTMTENCPPEPEVTSPVDEDVEIALLAKALGHPVRVRILRILLGRDACFCGQLVELLPVAQATVSQHLKVLRDAGLIRGEIDGPRVCYCANRERIRQLGDSALALAPDRMAGALVGGVTASPTR
jgi:ArsR family transcriptional regulator, arsenate/arsenite/antimonite-responsive transcriptional repressor